MVDRIELDQMLRDRNQMLFSKIKRQLKEVEKFYTGEISKQNNVLKGKGVKATQGENEVIGAFMVKMVRKLKNAFIRHTNALQESPLVGTNYLELYNTLKIKRDNLSDRYQQLSDAYNDQLLDDSNLDSSQDSVPQLNEITNLFSYSRPSFGFPPAKDSVETDILEESVEDLDISKENEDPPQTNSVSALVKYFNKCANKPPVDTIEVQRRKISQRSEEAQRQRNRSQSLNQRLSIEGVSPRQAQPAKRQLRQRLN